jgi:hypothetical protein
MGQSWEDIANEVAPVGEQSAGLATGSRRGGPLPAIAHESNGSLWLPTPQVPRVVVCPPCADDATLDDVLKGLVMQSTLHGTYYHVARVPLDYDESYAALPERLERVLAAEKFSVLSGAPLSKLLFLDIETTGLSSDNPLFLIGALWFDAQRAARLDLLLARDFHEERAVLAAYHARARGKIIITFNGKRFDWPYIEGRSRRAGLAYEQPAGHLDVLHLARRIWKNKVPNCRCKRWKLLSVAGRVSMILGRRASRNLLHLAGTAKYFGTWRAVVGADCASQRARRAHDGGVAVLCR